MSLTEDIDLKDLVRTIPDYPKPGIMFRDITTLLGHPSGAVPGQRPRGPPRHPENPPPPHMKMAKEQKL